MRLIVIVGTVAIAITVSLTAWNEEMGAASFAAKAKAAAVAASDVDSRDAFVQALGASSEEEIYEALYDGRTLAEIAEANRADVRDVIKLQIAELTAQLDQRLSAGAIDPETYVAQKAELAEIVTKSAYGQTAG